MTDDFVTSQYIPWKPIAASPDMMDLRIGNRAFPPAWRSSLAISVFEPPQPEDDQLCGQRVSFVKVTCSITGYQPEGDDREITFDDEPLEELRALVSDYLGCYGALLNVAFFPHGEEDRADPARYPRVLDFSPKNRELVRSFTEGGETLTGSSRDLTIDSSRTTTHKNETSVGLEVEAGFGDALKATGKLSHTWGETQEERQGTAVSAGGTSQEKSTYSTSLDQLYSLLTGYHAGTNRVAAVLLPRPGTLQPTSHRTFVQGLRIIEGIQDFVFLVSRPADVPGMCIEATLHTGHYPENTRLTGGEVSVERRAPATWRIRENRITGGDRFDATGQSKDFSGLVFDLPTGEDGRPWVLDTEAPGTDRGIRLREDRSRIHPSIPGWRHDGILAHPTYRQGELPVVVEPFPGNDRQVQARGIVTARGGNVGRLNGLDHIRLDLEVDLEFEIHLKRPGTVLSDATADREQMLITRRGLTACYVLEGDCPVAVESPPSGFTDRIDLSELPRLPRRLLQVSDPYAVLRGDLSAGAVAMANGSTFRNLGETDYFARRVASSLPPEMASAPVTSLVGSAVLGSAEKGLGQATVAQVLSVDLRTLARATTLGSAKARELRGLVLHSLEKKLALPDATVDLTGYRLLFASGSHELSKASMSTLEKIASVLGKNTALGIKIEGHTDSVGSDDANQALSERRAQAAFDYLVKQLKIPVSRLMTRGLGSRSPIDSNDTPEGRQNNRRVEFVAV